MTSQITTSLKVSHHKETLVKNVGYDDAKEKTNVQLLVVHCDLNDETHDAGVEHDKVPVHAQEEEVAE